MKKWLFMLGALAATQIHAAANLNWADQAIYFVLPDRFDNGDPSNDRAGDKGETIEDILRHGFNPGHRQYRHGGDIKGLQKKLDYLQHMGINSVWFTPIFKNKSVQANPLAGTETDALTLSYASYHGYWPTDFTQVDPHLGTNQDLKDFIADAHKRGIKVYFDVITNHTADVIKYKECPQPCLYKGPSKHPYNTQGDRKGPAINRGFVEGLWTEENFARLVNPNWAFTPYIPQGEESVKVPAWLNNVMLYHNRGNTTWTIDDGDDKLGDFLGLDDLFTEHPKVVSGMIDIYKYWIREFKIDGFRVDTVKHVNPEFWQAFVPAIEAYAKEQGIPDFFMFGEVFWFDPEQLSYYTKTAPLSAVLDFGFHRAAREVFAGGQGTKKFRQFYLQDDYYNGGKADVRVLPTFLDNHDIGRFSLFVKTDSPRADLNEITQRTQLAMAFQAMSRGVPVVYYGDEQGFMGTSGDKDCRQDMMANPVSPYEGDTLLASTRKPSDEHFNPEHPLYKGIQSYLKLRNEHRALRRGVLIDRYSEEEAGVYAFSRIDPEERMEYVVAFNTALTEKSAKVPTYANNAAFQPLFPQGLAAATSAQDATLDLKIPALSFVVYRNPIIIAPSAKAPKVKLNYNKGEKSAGNVEICAIADAETFSRAKFYAQLPGGKKEYIGEDITPSLIDKNKDVTSCRESGWVYRLWYDGTHIPNNTHVTFSVVLDDYNGHESKAEVPMVIDNRIKRVVVHYENGNQRKTAFALADDAPIIAAKPLKKGQFEFYWPGDAKDITLFFDSHDKKAIGVDKPIQLKFARDVLSNLGEDEHHQPIAHVYINNSHEVSGTDNFAADGDAKPAELFASTSDAPPLFGDKSLTLRGDMNQWADTAQLAYQAKLGVYQGSVMLSPGLHRFKFADPSWSDDVNFGAPFGKEKGMAIGDGSRPLSIAIPADGKGQYQFTMLVAKNDKGEPYRFFRVEKIGKK